MTITEIAEKNVSNYMQEAKENMLKDIETLKTVASFINPTNGHATEKYVKP